MSFKLKVFFPHDWGLVRKYCWPPFLSLVHLQFNCYSRTLRSKIEGYVALKNEAVYEFFEDGLIL